MKLSDEQREALKSQGLSDEEIDTIFTKSASNSGEQETDPDKKEGDDGNQKKSDDSASSGAGQLSVFEQAKAKLKSRSALASELKQAKADLVDAQSTITQLEDDLRHAQAEAKEGKALATEIAELKEEQTTVSKAAANIAASNHVDSSDLPEAGEDSLSSLEDIRSAIAATDDPKEKGRLARMARDMRNAEAGLN